MLKMTIYYHDCMYTFHKNITVSLNISTLYDDVIIRYHVTQYM